MELSPDNVFSSTLSHQHSEHQEVPPPEKKLTDDMPVPVTTALDKGVKEAEKGHSREKDGEKEEQGDADRLFVHLRENMETIREFCEGLVQQIPIPEQCVIEGNVDMTNGLVQQCWDSVISI